MFSGGVILSYFATGIACAVYASQWRKKPVLCEIADTVSVNDDDICDSVPLSATNALETVSISSIGSELSLLPSFLLTFRYFVSFNWGYLDS